MEFVAKTEASFSNLSHVPSDEIRNVSAEVAVVGKAVKEAISAQNNKQSVNVSGVVESGSTDTDLAVVKELFGFLGDDRVIPIEAFRLGKEPINGKPRLLKVRLSMLLRGLQYFERQSFLRALKNLRRYLCAPQLYRCTAIQCFVLESFKIPFPQYTLGDSILPRVNRVTDLGVVFVSDLKPSVQCSHIAVKASFFVNERFSNF